MVSFYDMEMREKEEEMRKEDRSRLLAVAKAADRLAGLVEAEGRGSLGPQLCDTEEWLAVYMALAAVEDLL